MDNNQRFPLQPPSHHHPGFTWGKVRVDPSATIAPGVVLQATNNSSIIIEAGVCIGLGVVITAYKGQIILNQGVVLGAGVLVIGAMEIGADTCIGRASTILNTSIPSEQAIAAYSVVGDQSRPPEDSQGNPNINGGKTQSNNESSPGQDPTRSSKSETAPPSQTRGIDSKSPVIGQVYVNELLLTIFPHHQHQQ